MLLCLETGSLLLMMLYSVEHWWRWLLLKVKRSISRR